MFLENVCSSLFAAPLPFACSVGLGCCSESSSCQIVDTGRFHGFGLGLALAGSPPVVPQKSSSSI